ncbi:unnamed protein product [Bursaphelenchus okinawaensis]|uniref:Uncharacterized protein n=1 Tax=Bursaphelenchus okinawaensis TaxID=465554 RepID=A0A811LH02_9BILA|nr:unnamed protein product [Bursaphelenchus okinawaensis]CAG9125062.1 unnamed protein product [Bursaphelenchus okinawaensis]
MASPVEKPTNKVDFDIFVAGLHMAYDLHKKGQDLSMMNKKVMQSYTRQMRHTLRSNAVSDSVFVFPHTETKDSDVEFTAYTEDVRRINDAHKNYITMADKIRRQAEEDYKYDMQLLEYFLKFEEEFAKKGMDFDKPNFLMTQGASNSKFRNDDIYFLIEIEMYVKNAIQRELVKTKEMMRLMYSCPFFDEECLGDEPCCSKDVQKVNEVDNL